MSRHPLDRRRFSTDLKDEGLSDRFGSDPRSATCPAAVTGALSEGGALATNRRLGSASHPRSWFKCVVMHLMVLTVALLVLACDHGPREKQRQSIPSEMEMTMSTTTAPKRPMLPAIDRKVVAELQTATFALG